jgi:hypothetical protein
LVIYVTRNSHTRQLAKLDKLPVVIRRDLILPLDGASADRRFAFAYNAAALEAAKTAIACASYRVVRRWAPQSFFRRG